MKLQRYGKDGLPRNEFRELPENEYQALEARTKGKSGWKPVRPKKIARTMKPLAKPVIEPLKFAIKKPVQIKSKK